MTERTASDAGFSLLETLIAFAVLSMAFAIVLPLLRDSGGAANQANDTRLALLIAKSRFAEVGRERPLEPGEWSGQDAGFSWRIVIQPNRAIPKENPYAMALFDVTVVISGAMLAAPEGIRLSTTRLGKTS